MPGEFYGGYLQVEQERSGIKRHVPYMVVDQSSELSNLFETLTSEIRLRNPSFVISVVGSWDEQTHLKERSAENFGTELGRLCRKANCWVIYGGKSDGLDHRIADSLQKEVIAESAGLSKTLFSLVGIEVWNDFAGGRVTVGQLSGIGEVNGSETIVKCKDEPCSINVQRPQEDSARFYNINAINHCFIGLTSNSSDSQSTLAKFRARFDLYLNSDQRIPSVSLVYHGSLELVQYISLALESENTSLVLIQGSGGFVDFLIGAIEANREKTLNSFVQQGWNLILENFPDLEKRDVMDFIGSSTNHKISELLCRKMFQLLFENRKRIAVFSDENQSLDYCVLELIFQSSQCKNPSEKLELFRQTIHIRSSLRLLLQDNSDDSQLFVSAILFEIITNESLDNLKSFLEYGFRLTDFINEGFLSQLYRHTMKIYPPFRKYLSLKFSKLSTEWNLRLFYTVIFKNFLAEPRLCFDLGVYQDPISDSLAYRDLTIWALFSKKQSCLDFFLSKCVFKVLTYLVLSRLSANYALVSGEADLNREIMNNLSEKLLTSSVKLLNKCASLNRKLTVVYLEMPLEDFSQNSTLAAAAFLDCKEILDTATAKKVIKQQWYNGLDLDGKQFISYAILPSMLRNISSKDSNVDSKLTDSYPTLLNIYFFYTSPVFRFFLHSLFYIIFAIQFSYFYLQIEDGHMTKPEIWCFIVSIIYILELFRPIFLYSAPARLKFRLWRGYQFHFLELIHLVCTITAFTLRAVFPRSGYATFMVANTFYRVSLFLILVKLVRFYQCSSRLGPIWIFIRKMLKQTLVFFAIFLVLVLAFGMCIHLSSMRTCDFVNMQEQLKAGSYEGGQWIFLKAYFMFFGEKFYNTVAFACQSRAKRYMSEIMLSLMLFVGNALVLNVLIALYRSVYCKVQQRSSMEWTTEMYWLLKECQKATFVPAPLNVIQMAIEISFWMVSRNKKVSEILPGNSQNQTLMSQIVSLEQLATDEMEQEERRRLEAEESMDQLCQTEFHQSNVLSEVIMKVTKCRQMYDTKYK